ncbi:MAG: hypothetical protein Fur0034_15300 [Desulfuromonadia bacterium]
MGRRRVADILPPLLLLAAAAVIRVATAAPPPLTADGTVYLQIARNILSGWGLGWEASWMPPGLSILVAAGSYLSGEQNILTVAGWVASLSYILLVPLLYEFGRRIDSPLSGGAAALLTATSPHILWIASTPEPEMLYTFFLCSALLFMLIALDRGSTPAAIGAGLTASAAYHARSEALVILFFVAILLLMSRTVRQTGGGRIVAVAVVTMLLSMIPYLLFLKGYYRGWVLSPKGSYVMIWMKGKTYQEHEKGEIFNDELWGLTPDGRYRWQEPKGVSDLLSYLAKDPLKSLRVYLRDISHELPGNIPNNSGMDHYPQVVPLYLAIPLTIFLLLPSPRGVGKKILLAAPLLIFFIFPLFTDGWWKYLVPYLPLVILMGVVGCRLAIVRFIPKERLRPLLFGCFVLFITLRFVAPRLIQSTGGGEPSTEGRMIYAREVEMAGMWGVQRFGRGRHYLSPWSKIVYHLDGRWSAEPVAPLPDVHRFALERGVDLVVKEAVGDSYRPEDLTTPPPGFVLRGLYRSLTHPYMVGFYAPVPIGSDR